MRKCLAGLVVGLVALAAGAAWAQEPAQEPAKAPAKDDHRQVSDVQVLSVVGHCFYGPNLDEAQAKRLCRQQVRGTLLDRAVAGFGAEPGVRGSGLSGRELRAFVDSLLTVDPVEEETRRVPEGLALRLTLRGAVRPGDRIEQVAVFLTDGAARSAALARLAEHDRLAAEARMAAVPFEAEREFAKIPVERLSPATALATHRLVRGMSLTSVKQLLGDPAGFRQSIIGAETYVCAAYAPVWVVFRDGVLACARTRLEYLGQYGTDCHCSGNPRGMVPLD